MTPKTVNQNQDSTVSCDAAEHIPQIGFIGWDVAITQNGVELIEGNHNPDYELLEYLGSNCYYEKITKIISSK
ncbi:MAG: sugar-transfer associated ATP-grasp domain-containing protein [Sodaliphilus sp.]|nr:sugar-transfer associated ATP-grasp domain-containing protein [Sodaliphilus sp.]